MLAVLEADALILIDSFPDRLTFYKEYFLSAIRSNEDPTLSDRSLVTTIQSQSCDKTIVAHDNEFNQILHKINDAMFAGQSTTRKIKSEAMHDVIIKEEKVGEWCAGDIVWASFGCRFWPALILDALEQNGKYHSAQIQVVMNRVRRYSFVLIDFAAKKVEVLFLHDNGSTALVFVKNHVIPFNGLEDYRFKCQVNFSISNGIIHRNFLHFSPTIFTFFTFKYRIL